MFELKDFCEPSVISIKNEDDKKYHPLQWGAKIKQIADDNFDWETTDIMLVGCHTSNNWGDSISSADAVRKQFYDMYCWHNSVSVVDAGNIKQGASKADTKAALVMVLDEIHNAGKIAIIIGDNHDITLQQYEVFRKKEVMATCAIADIFIDLDEAEETNSRSFLMDMLTHTPNFISHYSHIAFQSYYVQPHMLETLDKLRFDFYRLGKVKENTEEMEPVLRSSDFFSFDVSAIRYPDAITNINGSPNGLTGEDACALMKYAGMSDKLSSVGIYGYLPAEDSHEMTAKLLAQMMWYFIDGILVKQMEAPLDSTNEFMTFNVVFTENDTSFIKSKRTNRWWMKLPEGNYIPCSYNDYLQASNNEIPERWLREQERLV